VLIMNPMMHHFQKNSIWKLVSSPNDKSIIGTKWIFKNKLDENSKVVHNKVRLEVIRILLSFATHHNMRLHQMDVKCTFLNGIISEKVFMKQPPNFESGTFPNRALYGLKQAPRAWYEKPSSFLMKNGFQRGKVDTTLFCKNYDSHFIIVQIYVDDITFGSTDDSLYGEFSELM
ncbi:hypothetical protein CR513_12972, partial [Mucuna pruriens]